MAKLKLFCAIWVYTAAPPLIAAVNRFVFAYVCRVPCETAFRIVRRSQFPSPQDCPRWPPIFWDDAIHRGGGGACFESNYAFFALCFSSTDIPYHLECFLEGICHDSPLSDDITLLAQQLAQHFSIDEFTLLKALSIVTIAPKIKVLSILPLCILK